MTSQPLRVLPVIDDLNRGFWCGGADNELRVRRCQACGYWVHPPRPMCPKCRHRDLPWTATSGKATLYTYSLNHKAWNPDVPVPYLIGIVELPEQEGLRLTSNIVACTVDDVFIGMPLSVTFQQQGDVFVPLFEPDPVR